MLEIKLYINYLSRILESVGVLAITAGIAIALLRYTIITGGLKGKAKYKRLRQELGMAILLGLEILVAADIIGTVVTEPTLNHVLTLGLIVLIRTFLSLSLQVELEGKFPWQRNKDSVESE